MSAAAPLRCLPPPSEGNSSLTLKCPLSARGPGRGEEQVSLNRQTPQLAGKRERRGEEGREGEGREGRGERGEGRGERGGGERGEGREGEGEGEGKGEGLL